MARTPQRTIQPQSGKRRRESRQRRLVDEVRHTQRRAPLTTAGSSTIGQLVLFSTESGDAWVLDPTDHLAARVARGGEPEPIDIEETSTNFAIA
jgi:hypothetical protein